MPQSREQLLANLAKARAVKEMRKNMQGVDPVSSKRKQMLANLEKAREAKKRKEMSKVGGEEYKVSRDVQEKLLSQNAPIREFGKSILEVPNFMGKIIEKKGKQYLRLYKTLDKKGNPLKLKGKPAFETKAVNKDLNLKKSKVLHENTGKEKDDFLSLLL